MWAWIKHEIDEGRGVGLMFPVACFVLGIGLIVIMWW